MLLIELERLETRSALRQNPQEVIARAEQDIAAAEAALDEAGVALRAAKETREQGYYRLAQLNREYSITRSALRNSRQLALANDVATAFRESDKNRRRLQELADLIAYRTLWVAPEEAANVLQAEIDFEDAKNTLHESQCAKDRCGIYSLAIAARGIDAGATVDLSDSASARILKVVDRSRREIIPAMQDSLQALKEKMTASRNEASASLFG